MNTHPPGMTTIGAALEGAELALADIRHSIERDLAAHDVPADVIDAVLHRADLAAETARRHFRAKLADKIVKEH